LRGFFDDWFRCRGDRFFHDGFGSHRFGDGHRRLDCLDESRRRQRRRSRLRRLGRLLCERRLLALHNRRFGKDIAAGQDDIALTRHPVDELACHDFLDRARRALDLNPVIAFEQRRDFLARRSEQLCDFINPNS